jgi:hypothetical protein
LPMELVEYNAGRACLGQSYPPGFTNDARNNLSMELVDCNAGRTCLGQSYPPGFTNDARNLRIIMAVKIDSSKKIKLLY